MIAYTSMRNLEKSEHITEMAIKGKIVHCKLFRLDVNDDGYMSKEAIDKIVRRKKTELMWLVNNAGYGLFQYTRGYGTR